MRRLSKPTVALITLALAHTGRAAEPVTLDEVTVTGTREAQAIAETPASVGVIITKDIDELKASHPSEIMGTVPGVHVNVTGGEGHMTAIRQPITTAPVYLFLEDGVPTRSTGFFNHNALYEINLPQAGGIEVTKGPGSALYGSDAIGGVINVLTRPAPLQPEAEVSAEAGGHGWRRLLLSGGDSDSTGTDGYRGDLNLTHTDGWRDTTDYDRQSATLRWDRFLDSGAALKTVISAANIDQQTAGTSRLSKQDYLHNPTLNYTPVSFREVEALRISTAYEDETQDSLLSLTPYVRYNRMEILPNWSLSYDPQRYTTENTSVGLLSKYRRDFAPRRSRMIVGLDLDYSPGSYQENAIDPTRVGAIYVSYTELARTYDYDISFTSVSPYVHLETSPTEKLRLQAGLRFDYMHYDYDNHLGVQSSGAHRRPASTDVDFDHISPKLGLTYALSERLNTFAAYRNSFRAPSQSQLFRQGQAENTVGLKPVDAHSYEIGLRGQAGPGSYEVSLYYMRVEDDIVSFRNTVDGTRETQNAGETLHRGIEIGLETPLTASVQLDIAYSYAKHSYEEWRPATGTNYGGNEINSAPRQIGDVRLSWRPALLKGGRLELNWEHLGDYWLDDENTHRYDGHDLYHLRANYKVTTQLELFGRLENLTDERYATGASYSQFRGEEFAPGLPRTFYAGVSYHWR
ncbi:TonB-dependent receptor [Candidatus Tenderia electrophaga]|jgi:outer membrane receptor protein involved in Fe transport|uniref:TonB-dependent receptor n=1 Tax=Candidatus Tenderia electrophaga TaxID=1748243 RepID=A0A0S2TCC3_9GAMM|nr:TonB-dependent receptor [Candidatus Tenderia electrophaga]